MAASQPWAASQHPVGMQGNLRELLGREQTNLPAVQDEFTADAALERRPAKLHLDDVCARLGISVERVRARARELAAG